MRKDEILEAIQAYIMENYEIEADDPDFTPDVDLFDYGYLDSLSATEVLSWIEEEFSIEITQRDITLYPMNTLEEITEVVADKLA